MYDAITIPYRQFCGQFLLTMMYFRFDFFRVVFINGTVGRSMSAEVSFEALFLIFASLVCTVR